MLFGFSNSMFQSSLVGECGESNWSHAINEKKVTQSDVQISHWQNFKDDILNMKTKFNVTTYRVSIEWSHIEPLQGNYDINVLERYKELAKHCKSLDVEPMFTLHHFNDPLWFSNIGGFEKEENIKYFVNFCQYVFSHLNKYVKIWCTINEPAIYTFMGYFLGDFPPFCKLDAIKTMTVLKNLMIAHIETYHALKLINNSDDIEIGIVHNVLIFKKRYIYDPIGSVIINVFNEITNNVLMCFFETGIYHYQGLMDSVHYENLDAMKSNDFFGLNFYANPVVGPNFQNLYGATCFPDQVMGDMYLPIDPEGFSNAIDLVSKFGVPIYITETGIADHTDELRQNFLEEYLQVIKDKVVNGFNIKGIYFWTYRDNYEWNQSEKLFGFHDKHGECRESCKLLQNFTFSSETVEC